MAQKQVNVVENEIISILKINGKGWNIKLFEDETKATTCLCASCDGVCCDAVELDCDHEDEDIYLYCKPCLSDLIKQNNNKCPINSHDNPAITSSRASRRQISKSLVICPYSSKYKSKQNVLVNDNNQQIVDTIGGDEKEGIQYQNIEIYDNDHKNIGCEWKGTLIDLINKHIIACSKIYNPSFTLNIRIKKLENENKILNDIINDKENELQAKILIINQQNISINELKEQNQKLTMIGIVNEQELNKTKDLKDTIQSQRNTIDALQKTNQLLVEQLERKCTQVDEQNLLLQDEKTTTKLLREQNQKLQNTIQDQEAIIRALTTNNQSGTVDVKHEEKKNDETFTKTKMRFFTDLSDFKMIDDKTVKYKSAWTPQSGMFCGFGYSKEAGYVCKEDDQFTAYFTISSKGAKRHYEFGFATKDFSKWSRQFNPLLHAIHCYGCGGSIEFSQEFSSNKGLKTVALIDDSLNTNTIAFSIDMTQKIGCIWNDANKHKKITIKLPGPVFIIFGFGGTDGKILKLKKITFH
eukprot:195786_1